MNYFELVDNILVNGIESPSRMGTIVELIGLPISFHSMDLFFRPGMARKLGWVEAMQVLGGVWDDKALCEAAPNLRYEYGITHAYGLRVARQLPKIIKQLSEHPETRRALVYIGDLSDGYEEEKPCVTLWQFLARNNRLDMSCYIRSWDIISGFPYDTMVMGCVCQAIAEVLDLLPGIVTVLAGSAHIYTTDIPANRLPLKDNRNKIFKLPTFGDWSDVVSWARHQLLLLKDIGTPSDIFIEEVK